MNLEQRVELLVELGDYMRGEDGGWQEARDQASLTNGWFTPEFIRLAIRGITEFLHKDKLEQWLAPYALPQQNPRPRSVGIVMAGNIPLVGFHDFLCAFICGHHQTLKPSARDQILIRRLIDQMVALEPEVGRLVNFAERLNGCEAFIATGSNNSARYFDYYFAKYPHIIRRNRTSVAILSGRETDAALAGLADDVYQYFGLGCRNATKLYTPDNYDFVPLLEAFRKYDYLADHHKYKNNYDYHLALLILNKKQYMTNGSLLLEENPSFFSPISVLHYQYYAPAAAIRPELTDNPDIQCIIGQGQGYIPFGKAQQPALNDYADGVDTLQFLKEL